MEEKIYIENKQTLKLVFEQYYKPLVLYANNLIHSKEASEDFVQNIFVTLWKDKRHFENNKTLKAFLYKAIRNKCLNYIKHEQVKQKYSIDILNNTVEAKVAETEHEMVVYLHNAIARLPKRRKQVIKLYLKGLKNQEIAERLSIKLQTVKILKVQAYQNIRSYFKDKKLRNM